MESGLDRYVREHSTAQSEALLWLEKQTNIRTNYPQMLSGAVQGEFLKMLVQSVGARKVLEIGTFTGYSAIWMASGLQDGGILDSYEINDEMESLIREAFRRSGLQDRIVLHIGGFGKNEASLLQEESYDFVFIDANKREYPEYYDAVFPLVRRGGLIVADDTLWSGRVYAEKVPTDPQTEGVVRFNEKVVSDSRVECVLLPVRHGLTLIRKK